MHGRLSYPHPLLPPPILSFVLSLPSLFLPPLLSFLCSLPLLSSFSPSWPPPPPAFPVSHHTSQLPTAHTTPATTPASTQTPKVRGKGPQTRIPSHPPPSTPTPSPTPPPRETTLMQYREESRGYGGYGNVTYFSGTCPFLNHFSSPEECRIIIVHICSHTLVHYVILQCTRISIHTKQSFPSPILHLVLSV